MKARSDIEQAQQFLRAVEALTPEERKALGALMKVMGKEAASAGFCLTESAILTN